ncbi:MAG: tyrosine-type recombinase/integrase [Clostridia bacterium]
MQTKKEVYRVVKFRFKRYDGTDFERYLIVKNHIPLFRVNQWLEIKGMRKSTTGREYAKKLSVFLNWLDRKNMSYENATNKEVRQFLHSLIFGDLKDNKVLSLQSSVSTSTLNKYIAVITKFYVWLDEIVSTEMVFKKKNANANKSYFYGQIYSYEYKYLVDSYASMLKPSKEYTKWYDEKTKLALINNFLTLRDESVFRLTLEGMRIDEVLSVTLDSYNPTEKIVQPTRSKGRKNATSISNQLRVIALPSDTCKIINRYIQTERFDAEIQSQKLRQNLFINLNQGKFQGEPLKYRNYLKILKSCAKRAGLDENKIRTHNGRSTKTMEFLEHQALYPEDNITDIAILESMGWRNPSSINSYRDHNNQIIAKTVMEKLHRKRECND